MTITILFLLINIYGVFGGCYSHFLSLSLSSEFNLSYGFKEYVLFLFFSLSFFSSFSRRSSRRVKLYFKTTSNMKKNTFLSILQLSSRTQTCDFSTRDRFAR